MEEKTAKKCIEIGNFYAGLRKKEKTQFLRWLEYMTGYRMTALSVRIKTNGWSHVEREAIIKGIDSDQWRQYGLN